MAQVYISLGLFGYNRIQTQPNLDSNNHKKLMAKHIETGRSGETLARLFLEQKGYEILEQNYRFKKGEIDLIVFKEPFLIFVEVKTRSKTNFGMPETAVSARKAQLLMQTAENYLIEKNYHAPIRFDIVAIVASQPPQIEHLEDVFF
jgi:putative endonuclease